MTCIIAVVKEDTVYMGGDRAGLESETYHLSVVGRPKVFILSTLGTEMLIGFTSSFKMGQVLEYELQLPQFNRSGESPLKYMVTKFIPTVHTLFIDKKYTPVGSTTGGQFLVGFQGQLFIVDTDFQVRTLEEKHYAIGCGRDLALGSLFSTEDLGVRARVLLALEAAARYSAGVCGPFDILELK